MYIRFLVIMSIGLALSTLLTAAELTPAVQIADIDAGQCRAFIDGRDLGVAPVEGVLSALGLPMAQATHAAWTTGESAGSLREFRVAFTRPVEIGAICTTATGGREENTLSAPHSGAFVSYLKADAAYPGDVTRDEQWCILPRGEVKTLPPGVKTRALRFSDRYDSPVKFPSHMGMAVLFTERYYSALNLGYSKQSGKANHAEVWLGYWNTTQTVAGIVLLPQRSAVLAVEQLKPGADQHPLIAETTQWSRLADSAAQDGPTIYKCDKLLTTRALRLTAPNWRAESNFAIVLPLVNLGATDEPPILQLPPPPFAVKYAMPLNGFAAVDILDAHGQRVRRLIAETPRTKGTVEEVWDLKDDRGEMVPPGEYTVHGLARPPLKLTYELTVNNSGQPAWFAPPPAKGGGGWLADHSPPYCAQAVGDLIFLGSQVCENGHSLIAVDHAGNKRWGEPSVSWGFSGPERIASDGKYAYLVNNALIQRVDPQHDFAAETIYDFKFPRNLPGNGDHWTPSRGGAAAWGDKLYVSFCAPPVPWLQAFLPEVIDPGKCLPPIRLAKGAGTRNGTVDKNYSESEYDELMKLYAAFLTERTPENTKSLPDVNLPSSTQAYFGDAPADGPLAGTLTVAFTHPVPIGSVLLPDAATTVYALKPGEKLPDAEPNMEGNDPDLVGGGTDTVDDKFSEEHWVPLTTSGKTGQPALAVAPEGGVTTQALRFRTSRLTYALCMSRRFDNLAPQAERVYAEGQRTPHGGWSTAREVNNPISTYNPALMGLVWDAPVTLRGVAFVRPVAGIMEVDAFTGAAGADPKAALSDDSMWRPVGSFDEAVQVYHGYFTQEATLRSVDFGELVTTRALRFRVTGPPGCKSPYAAGNAVPGPHHAGFDAVLACHYLGGDPPGLPRELHERITEYQLPAMPKARATELRHIVLKKPGQLAFDSHGTLYAVSDGRIVTVPLAGNGEAKVVIAPGQLIEPSALTFDADGLLYVGDCGPGVVKVFDVKSGRLVRTIGTPGGHQPGGYDPLCMDRPTGLTIDSAGKLWIAHNSYQPKRVSRWGRDGTHEQDFFGVTAYGGGGWLDEKDRSVLNYNGMKFVIDWDKRTWKLADILFRPGAKGSIDAAMPDRVVYCQGRRYLVGEGATLVICQERNGVAVPLVAAGNLGRWREIDAHAELRKKFSAMERTKYGFLWIDTNGDGVPQADEIQLTEQNTMNDGDIVCRCIGDDLSLNFPGARLRPIRFLPSGAPVYDLAKLENRPAIDAQCWSTADGRTFVKGHKLLAPDGNTLLWEHTDHFLDNTGYYRSGFGANRPAGVLDGEHLIVGHLTVGKEELFVTNSDQGDWFVFTADGMLAGCIFGGPARQPRRYWTLPEWAPGKTDLSGLCVGQEHYQGCVVKADDGKVYAVAGHNHNSIVRVDGLEAMQRFTGTFTLSAADIERTQLWAVRKAAMERVTQEAKVARVPYLSNPVAVDGSLDDWPDDLFVTIHEYWEHSLYTNELITHSQGALAYDEKNLYVAVRSMGSYPLKNNAEDVQRLFKYGDAVDLTLGLDPNADPARTGPAPGDIRILLSRVKGRMVAVLYRYKSPNATPEKRVHFKSPVSDTWIDEVEELSGVELASGPSPKGWALEAAIPWAALGVSAPKIGTKLRGDIGILQGDQNGMSTIGRLYWAGKTQTVISDLPSEARIAPALWGDLYFMEAEKEMRFGPDEVEMLDK